MRRGVVFGIGAAILGTGVWLIATEHARDAMCKASTGLFQGTSAACQSIGWDYFLGFVAAAVGVIVMLFTGLMKRHEARGHVHGDRVTDYSLRMHPSPNPRRIPSRTPTPSRAARRRQAVFSEDVD